jgi:predicted nucleic-acid-binding protein
METTEVLLSMLAEMKKMSATNAQLLTVIQQQTDLIKEQKIMLETIWRLQRDMLLTTP